MEKRVKIGESITAEHFNELWRVLNEHRCELNRNYRKIKEIRKEITALWIFVGVVCGMSVVTLFALAFQRCAS